MSKRHPNIGDLLTLHKGSKPRADPKERQEFENKAWKQYVDDELEFQEREQSFAIQQELGLLDGQKHDLEVLMDMFPDLSESLLIERYVAHKNVLQACVDELIKMM
jgi:CUE domain